MLAALRNRNDSPMKPTIDAILECKTHKIPFQDSDCPRCGGNGYTESDIDDFNDPFTSSSGCCYVCKGSGVLKKSFCEECEMEMRNAIDEEE